MREDINQLLRQLPQVDSLMNLEGAKALAAQYSAGLVAGVLRDCLQELRQQLLSGRDSLPDAQALLEDAAKQLQTRFQTQKPPVINATGILLHTNLGRAPLAQAAADAAREAGLSYSALEYDLDTGARGDRQAHVERLVQQLLGAEAALVVNNNAAAVLLMLAALAQGKEVVVSRGELVEIGGAFRVPEVMEQSSCLLCEVGTTNKTKPRDFTGAITEQTAALLKVHTSNYKIMGFTETVEIAQLAQIAKAAGLPLLCDLGSGALLPLSRYGLDEEPCPRKALADGAHVVCFSGDKLLGGPQAGILAGDKPLIDQMKKHPLMRALRPGKLSLAALEATFRLHQDEALARRELPLYAMLGTSLDALYHKAQALKSAIRETAAHQLDIVQSQAQLGGGSAPGESLPSVALGIIPAGLSVQDLAQRLRQGKPPVIARIHKDQLLLDMRTVREQELQPLAQALQLALMEEARHA